MLVLIKVNACRYFSNYTDPLGKIFKLHVTHCSNTTIIEPDTCGYDSGVGGTVWMLIDPSRLIFEFERGNFEKKQNLKHDP